jgi:hypothetical protein
MKQAVHLVQNAIIPPFTGYFLQLKRYRQVCQVKAAFRFEWRVKYGSIHSPLIPIQNQGAIFVGLPPRPGLSLMNSSGRMTGGSHAEA